MICSQTINSFFVRSTERGWSGQSESKLSVLLLQNVKHLKPIEEAYQKVTILSDIEIYYQFFHRLKKCDY